MKPYEKPVLMALSLSGNDALCACAYDAVGDNMSPEIRRMLENSGLLDGDRPMRGSFGGPESCDEDKLVLGYCKFGPTGEIVFNS